MCSHSVVKLHETTEMLMMIEYVRKMTVKMTVKKLHTYDEYGLFEHLFSFVVKGGGWGRGWGRGWWGERMSVLQLFCSNHNH